MTVQTQPQSLAEFLGVRNLQAPETPVTVGPEPEMTAESFCRDILNTVQYRESLLRRILLDELPPAVECLLYHYAHGKPVERVEHTGKQGAPVEVITRIVRVIVDPSERIKVEQVESVH